MAWPRRRSVALSRAPMPPRMAPARRTGEQPAMDVRTNELGQPIGAPLPGWTPRPRPPRSVMEGRFCRLEPLDPDRHAADLFEAYADNRDGRMWTYTQQGPFNDLTHLSSWMRATCPVDDPLEHAT